MQNVSKDQFCYVSLFGGFFGWCYKCERVMFHSLMFKRHIQGSMRAVGKCEECGTRARLIEGELIRADRLGFWQKYNRL